MRIAHASNATKLLAFSMLQLAIINAGCGNRKTPAPEISNSMESVTEDSKSQNLKPTFGPPDAAATKVVFEDRSAHRGVLSGLLRISRALDERTLSHYVVYWGTDASTKLANSFPIATLSKNNAEIVTEIEYSKLTTQRSLGLTTSANLLPEITYEIPPILRPANVTHLLIRTKNASGEMLDGVSEKLIDKTSPLGTAGAVGFHDIDIYRGRIAGDVVVVKSPIENDITEYILYWGSEPNKKSNHVPFASLEKTGNNLIHELPMGTIKPESAQYILVYTKNSDGEMPYGVSTLIIDRNVPNDSATAVSFVDTDLELGKIGGTVTVTRAHYESNLTHYVLYWGSSASVKSDEQPFGILAKGSGALAFNLPHGKVKSESVNHILVFTKNAHGEMPTGVSVQIEDRTEQ